ncbi:hypothetical protein [Aureispira anguillae]|uniref:Uncharacterized protein n=1 Tax=Aureispira anguillae TaxID=2864201 RepID=A0A915YGS6_9BACT|nr:hypothetical protein [Aureispira anguillae]BDS12757.1 hypothetical protein AsAng_0034820 [Aureispira anguillae]
MLYTIYLLFALILSVLLGMRLLPLEERQALELPSILSPTIPISNPPQGPKRTAKCQGYYRKQKAKRRKRRRLARRSKQQNRRIIKSN